MLHYIIGYKCFWLKHYSENLAEFMNQGADVTITDRDGSSILGHLLQRWKDCEDLCKINRCVEKIMELVKIRTFDKREMDRLYEQLCTFGLVHWMEKFQLNLPNYWYNNNMYNLTKNRQQILENTLCGATLAQQLILSRQIPLTTEPNWKKVSVRNIAPLIQLGMKVPSGSFIDSFDMRGSLGCALDFPDSTQSTSAGNNFKIE